MKKTVYDSRQIGLSEPNELFNYFDYNPETGELICKNYGSCKTTFIEQHDGSLARSMVYTKYRAHIVAWTMYYGEWPKDLVKFKDGDKNNFKISNLYLYDEDYKLKNKPVISKKIAKLRTPKFEISELQERIRYEKETGLLYWKPMKVKIPAHERWNSRYSNTKALDYVSNNGRKIGSFQGEKGILNHHVVWALNKGRWPLKEIDHINGDCLDNRIENLREVTSQENSQNMSKNVTNTSGVTGVYWNKNRNVWSASIMSGGNSSISLGSYENFNDAIKARKLAEKQLNFNENHGRLKK